MPVTKDIGNGFQMIDVGGLIDTAAKGLSLAQLAAEMEMLPAKKSALAAQAQANQMEQAERSMRLRGQALTAAVSGDLDTANGIVRQYVNPNLELAFPSDLKKKSRGILVATDKTSGNVFEIDPYKELGIQKQIDVQADLARKAGEIALTRPKEKANWIRENAVTLSKESGLSPREALKAAEAIYNAAEGYQKTNGDMRSLSQDDIKGRIQASTELTAAQIADSPLDQPLQKLQPIPEQPRAKLEGIRTVNNYLTREILPRFQDMKKEFFSDPNILSAPIQSLLSKFNQGDPRLVALRSVIGTTLFDEIKRKSGSAFTKEELEARRQLLPQANDTLGEAMAKVAALASMNSRDAASALSTLEASGHQVGGMRRLFQGANIHTGLSDDSDRTAQIIMESLPPSLRTDRQGISEFANYLSPEIAPAFRRELERRQGKPPQAPASDARAPQTTPKDTPQSNLERFNQIRMRALGQVR